MLPPIIKMIFAGEAGVGKSSLVRRLTQGTFQERYIRSIDVRVYMVKYKVGNRTILIGLRDPMGHRPILPYVRPYMEGAHAAILTFDIHRPHTLYELGYRVTTFLTMAGKKPMILVGNKKDLRNEVEYYVTTEEGKEFANELSKILDMEVPYLEVSAKTGENVDAIIPTALGLLTKMLSPHQQRGSVFLLRALRSSPLDIVPRAPPSS